MERSNVLVYPENSAEAKNEAVKLLTSKFKEIIQKNEQSIFFMSGGTWVEIMNKISLSKGDAESLSGLLTITSLDDRLTTGNDNNFKKISETSIFIKTLLENGAKVISTIPESDLVSVKDFGLDLDKKITNWFKQNPNGYALATVGVGGIENVEGHTAGIAPMSDSNLFNSLFVNTDNFYVGYESDKLTPPKRVTATFKLLEKVDKLVLILDKTMKQNALKLAVEGKAPLNEVPAAFLGRNSSKTKVVTDIEFS